MVQENIGTTPQRVLVWSPVYVDALILRDRDSDSNGSLDQRRYALQDAQWNVTSLVNTAGDMLERYRYDPYGERTVLNASWAVRTASLYAWEHGHQGLRHEVATGNIENRMRWLRPSVQRFVTADPAGFVDGTNLYVYVGGNPVNFVDPGGL